MAGPLGTLIVVVLKARNLPNKQRIGKQDPYATCTYLSHRKRTKTDKRGGQHPVWDDELRFDIYDNPKEAMASASVSTTATGGVVPVKSNAHPVGSVGAMTLKELRVAVYADDPRDPDLIGEGKVDLTETLKKGEFDDWVTVTNKGKYQGEVYLEMTFYSAKPPPDKLQTPTGPIRAGVFEASSPGSGKRPTPTQSTTSHALNKKPSPSPSCTPSKTINPNSVPTALRAGRPMSGPISTGHLPFPGEPSTSKNASVNSRQRSTGSLSMPTPDFGLDNRPPSRAPSRNHSLDRSDHLVDSMNLFAPPLNHSLDRSEHLVDSMNSLSLSGRTSAHSHVHSSQPKTSELAGFPTFPSHQRPFRHSFSGHPHAQPDHSTTHPQSVGPSVHTVESAEERFPNHPAPQYVDSAYPDRFAPSPQPQRAPRPSLTARRPLPIPGGDSVHRPPSAWGHSQNIAGGQRYANEVPVMSQQLPTTYTQYPDDHERPSIPIMSKNVPTYPSQMQYADNPPNGLHQQPIANRPPHVPYSSQQLQYYPTPPPQNPPFAPPQLSGHVPYNLPPPPAGQAPVPIHEVFASSSSRPFPSSNPGGYHPPGGFPTQHSQVPLPPSRPNTSGETVYTYQVPHSECFQPYNQNYNSPIENPISHHNLYSSQNGPHPPPPPLHSQQQQLTQQQHQQQQQQMQYQPFVIQQPNSGVQVPPPPPSAPSSAQMYYHQPTYAPNPPSTPEPGFNSLNAQPYPEHNNPFHNPQRPDSAIPGNVYTRASLSTNPLPPVNTHPPPPPSSLPSLSHGPPHSSSPVPFYYSSGPNQPTPTYPQT